MQNYLPLLFFLVIAAVLLRDDTVLTAFYLLAGVYFTGRWWSRRALNSLTLERRLATHAFPGETVPVQLRVTNHSWLPLAWLQVHESLPADLGVSRPFQEVVAIGARGSARFEYNLHAYKRGYYSVGPLFLSSGDVFGLEKEQQRVGPAVHLTVYPRVVPLARLGLPSHAPLGSLRQSQPVFEDPARVSGKRLYLSGDSLRRVDWKATAATGRLLVKKYDPSTALEVFIALDFAPAGYDLRSRHDAMELAVVVAASIAHWSAENQQPVGLAVSGADAASAADAPPRLPPRRGRGHLARLLEVLARVQPWDQAPPLPAWLQQAMAGLPWGATLVVITGGDAHGLLETLLRARRAGLHPLVIFTQPGRTLDEARRRAARFGIPVHVVARERDLAPWRRE